MGILEDIGNSFTIPSKWGMDLFKGLTGQETAEKTLDLYNKQLKLSKEQLYHGTKIKMKDMIDAGLNPVLAATQGQSAQTTMPAIPDLKGLGGEGITNLMGGVTGIIKNITGAINESKSVNSAVKLNNTASALNEAKAITEAKKLGLIDSEAAKNWAQSALENERMQNEKLRYDQILEEVSQAQIKTQTMWEQLHYAKKHAKADWEIKHAQQRYDLARAELAEKENDMYYWTWGTDRGLKIADEIIKTYIGSKIGKFMPANIGHKAAQSAKSKIGFRN